MPSDIDFIVTKAGLEETGYALTSRQWQDISDYMNEALEAWLERYYDKPECCTHEYESACPCCVGECDHKEDTQ